MRNIWLYIVLSSIFAIVVACGYTIYKSLDYPIETANPYFEKFDEVYKNYDILAQNRQNFEQNYSFSPLFRTSLEVAKNKRAVLVRVGEAKDFAFETNASVTSAQAVLTRPHTQKADANLTTSFAAGELVVKDVAVSQKGRWQVELRVDAQNATKLYTIELWAE